ncbi:hypothetical protein, partial [Methanoregula sp.]|uniref:hypothetical protein n=1 Tax=Methanoregula sp. TaxID=2052170 RepID=UPI003BB0D94D
VAENFKKRSDQFLRIPEKDPVVTPTSKKIGNPPPPCLLCRRKTGRTDRSPEEVTPPNFFPEPGSAVQPLALSRKFSMRKRTIPGSPATSSGFLEKFDNHAGLFF